MNADFFAALEQLEKEKGISQSYMLEKIAQSKRVNTKEDILTDKNLRSGNS